jgi:murein DD-endopeptidase MepM/ murein hydrolase activator NlpD
MTVGVARIFPFAIAEAGPLSLSGAPVDVGDLAAFSAYIAARRGARPALVGGYGEDRGVYAASSLFGGARHGGDEPRTIHLGVDVWTDAGTPLRAPLDAVVHSLADNRGHGDYGGTVILSHATAAGGFHTLYGHLARRSLEHLRPGQALARGEVFAWLGEAEENGGWPPHLHLQKILDLGGRRGDFPGVARRSERARWLRICPDPGALLA